MSLRKCGSEMEVENQLSEMSVLGPSSNIIFQTFRSRKQTFSQAILAEENKDDVLTF